MKKKLNLLRQRKERARIKPISTNPENNYLISPWKNRSLAYPMKDLKGIFSLSSPHSIQIPDFLPRGFLGLAVHEFAIIHLLDLSYFLEEKPFSEEPVEVFYGEVDSLFYGIPACQPCEKKVLSPGKISPTTSFPEFIEGIYGEEKRTLQIVRLKKLVEKL